MSKLLFIIRQRYNLKAIHNSTKDILAIVYVVYQYVKDTIWKQFTTIRLNQIQTYSLFINTSKIQFESNSQHMRLSSFANVGCLSIRQRYNLKAIHNIANIVIVASNVVYQYVKDTIWKQFTTYLFCLNILQTLFINTSKIQFESNSQRPFIDTYILLCCLSIRQRYNLKAIHNPQPPIVKPSLVVYQYVKDTIWKQFTTCILCLFWKKRLFINTSKIQFESNSQLLVDRS